MLLDDDRLRNLVNDNIIKIEELALMLGIDLDGEEPQLP